MKAQDSAGDGDYVDWNTDDDLEIDNFQLSPLSSPVQPRAETLVCPAVVSVSSRHNSNNFISLCLSRQNFIIPYVNSLVYNNIRQPLLRALLLKQLPT